MKCIYIIMDGVGDLPSSKLDGLTPLQAAKKPNIDSLANAGVTGLMDVYSPGIPVGTDIGHICLFGYDAQKVYSGRGPIEAIGAGVSLSPGDIAFRGNFATIDENGILIDKRAGRINKKTDQLIADLSKIQLKNGIKFTIKQATEHRFVVVFHGIKNFPTIADAYPGHKCTLPCKFPWSFAPDNSSESSDFAFTINEFIRNATKILANHNVNTERINKDLLPANTILLRGGGQFREFEKFSDKFYGVSAGIVAAEDTVLGLAKMASIESIKRKGMTGGYDTNYNIKAQSCIELLKTKDLVFLHVKATDLAGHDKLPMKKKEIIEHIDLMIKIICDNIDASNTMIAIASDHSTPCLYGEHTADPVPILLSGPNLRKDITKSYDEISAMSGGLGRIKGNDFIKILLSSGNFIPKYGD